MRYDVRARGSRRPRRPDAGQLGQAVPQSRDQVEEDVGRSLAPRGDARVRAIGLAPSQWLEAPGHRTMDELLAHYEPATV